MKRISFLVLGAHLVVLLWMALWMPARKIPKKPLVVRTVTEVVAPPPAPAPAPAPKPVPTVVKASPPKPKPKPAPKKVTRPVQKPKAPAISTALLKQLEMSIAKIEETGQKQVSKAPNLQIDTITDTNASIYAANLIQCLQSALTLPSVGAVKVELTLRNDGSFVKMRIVNSQSNPNKAFLETHLASMKYPAFSGELKKEKEHAFVITFCNN